MDWEFSPEEESDDERTIAREEEEEVRRCSVFSYKESSGVAMSDVYLARRVW